MKKLFLTAAVFMLLGLLCISASAAQISDTYLISNTNGCVFETVFSPDSTLSCTPILAVYDQRGALCGISYGEDISLTQGTKTVKTFPVTTTGTPTTAKLMLWNSDGSFTPIGFENIDITLSPKKFGFIMEADSTNGIKLLTEDGNINTYSFADNFIMSYKNTVITNEATAFEYLNSLRLKSYQRFAHIDSNNDGKADSWSADYHWLLLFNNESRYSQDVPSKEGSTALLNDYLYDYADFFNNYEKRAVEVLISPEDEIVTMAFADDSYFGSLSSDETFKNAYYNSSTSSFNDSYKITNDVTVLYCPTRNDVTESQYTKISAGSLPHGGLYHAKSFVTSSGKDILFITYMKSTAEIQSFNSEPKTNINLALNGNGGTAPGLKNRPLNISLDGTKYNTPLNEKGTTYNDIANNAASEMRANLIIGLEGAIKDAENGYAITPSYVKNKFKANIDIVRTNKNEIENLDETLGITDNGYFSALEKAITDVIGETALMFLYDYFIN